MEKDKVIRRLRSFFKNRQTVNTEDLRRYFQRTHSDLPDNTLRRRIHEMETAGILVTTSGNRFLLPEVARAVFRPGLNEHLQAVAQALQAVYTGPYCLTYANWLNEFSRTLHITHLTVIEVAGGDLDRVYDHFIQRGKGEVYHLPRLEVSKHRLTPGGRPTVIKPFVENAPLQQVEGLWVPTLEKLLVDLFCDEMLFPDFHGRETKAVFEKAFDYYQIDEDRLLDYAAQLQRDRNLKRFLADTGLQRN